jgi:membrane-bound lytic murein transglycosylase B
MTLRKTLLASLLSASVSFPSAAAATADGYAERPEMQEFIEEMIARHGFEAGALSDLLLDARPQPSIVAAISSPAEARPWHRYRPIFLTPSRIQGGVEYWNQHGELLARAEQVYGVAPEIIVAIIGVETLYGANTGRHRVLDALATLAFDYPPRSTFFRRELEQYLLLTREEGLDARALTGSYAGAMGKPQFISSSYRAYAVDFDGSGQRDLWNNTADVIGSVANYLHVHGWRADGPVAVPVRVNGEGYRDLLGKGLKPHFAVGELSGYGVEATETLPADELATLIALENENGHEHWLGLNNFYVITRYNRSPLYAMAVYQLAEAIREAREGQ